MNAPIDHLLTYDLETFYDTKTKYSLSSMTPEEYIRDERFQIIGASVSMDGKPSEWMAADDPNFPKWFRSFPWESSAALAHNGAAFDHMVLGLRMDIHPAFLLDTLQIARVLHGSKVGNSLKNLVVKYGLGEKGTEVIQADGLRLEDFPKEQLRQYGKYCCNDTDLCLALFLKLKEYFTPSQFVQGHLFARMASRPQLELDLPLLDKAYAEEVERKKDLLGNAASLFDIDREGMKKLVMSNKRFAGLLEILGVEVPMKVSPRTGKLTYAFAKTDTDFTDLLDCGDPVIEEVVNLRLGAKSTIMETRLARFIGIAQRGPSLPVMLRLHGAHSGRASGRGGKQNLQNLNKRMGAKNPLRLSIRAPAGRMCCAADSSQVEVRTLGDATGETRILEAFKRGIDPYKEFAVPLYQLSGMDQVNKDQRQIAKSAVLAAGFGQGGKGFQAYCRRSDIDISLDDAERTIMVYRDLHPMVVQFWKECGLAIRAMITGDTFKFGVNGRYETLYHALRLPSGRLLYYHGLRYDADTRSYVYFNPEKRREEKIYSTLLCENVIQADAYDAVMWQAEQIYDEAGWEPALQVHDELVYVRPEGEVEVAEKVITKWMSTTPPFFNGVVLACEFGVGKTYAEV